MVPSEQIIDIGRKARLECLTEERDRGAIEWRKDGRALPAHVARLVATRNVLQIFNLQREDYGMYQCFVDRGSGRTTWAGAGTGDGVCRCIQIQLPPRRTCRRLQQRNQGATAGNS